MSIKSGKDRSAHKIEYSHQPYLIEVKQKYIAAQL
jgi:hypothetical protein